MDWEAGRISVFLLMLLFLANLVNVPIQRSNDQEIMANHKITKSHRTSTPSIISYVFFYVPCLPILHPCPYQQIAARRSPRATAHSFRKRPTATQLEAKSNLCPTSSSRVSASNCHCHFAGIFESCATCVVLIRTMLHKHKISVRRCGYPCGGVSGAPRRQGHCFEMYL